MSYGLDAKCNVCKKFDTCIDYNFIYGAIQGIHTVNTMVNNVWTNKGHKGYGNIKIDCNGFEE